MARPIKTVLNSSSLAAVIYDPSDGTLDVEYRRNGHFYRYFDIPMETYRALLAADSKGAFLNEVIKPQHEYTRIDFPMA